MPSFINGTFVLLCYQENAVKCRHNVEMKRVIALLHFIGLNGCVCHQQCKMECSDCKNIQAQCTTGSSANVGSAKADCNVTCIDLNYLE